MLRWVTAGESHGPMITVIIEGIPANTPIDVDLIDAELARRQLGYGRGGRMEIEKDRVTVLSGVRFGRSIGSPLAMAIENKDSGNWKEEMSIAGPRRGDRVTTPRPGHADLPGLQKTGLDDVRDVLERASARETAARVAAGAVAKQLLAQFGVAVYSYVKRIGSAATSGDVEPTAMTKGLAARIDDSPVRTVDEETAGKMVSAIDEAGKRGDTLGGIFEIIVTGMIPGLGGYAAATERLGGRLAGAIMSIPAIKGVEVGDGFRLGRTAGSEVHDEILFDSERGFHRRTNHAGGIEGGMTNGEPVVLRAAMKPIATLGRPLATVDMKTKEAAGALAERADVCAVPAAAVVAESMVALELAKAWLEKFGGDNLDDVKRGWEGYLDRLRKM